MEQEALRRGIPDWNARAPQGTRAPGWTQYRTRDWSPPCGLGQDRSPDDGGGPFTCQSGLHPNLTSDIGTEPCPPRVQRVVS